MMAVIIAAALSLALALPLVLLATRRKKEPSRTAAPHQNLAGRAVKPRTSDQNPPPMPTPWNTEMSEACRHILDEARRLELSPPRPELLRHLSDPDLSANMLGLEISKDQNLAAMVLRAANSPFYRASRQVRDITEALVIVGIDEVRNLVFARIARVSGRRDAIDDALWRHALATAIAAQACARSLKGVTVSHAFLGGMLHDIGKNVLHRVSHDYGEIWNDLQTLKTSDVLEREHYQTDHREVGAFLLRTWKFPSFYELAAFFHHTPLSTPAALRPVDQRLIAMIALSGEFVRWRGFGNRQKMETENFASPDLLRVLGGTPALLRVMSDEIEKEFDRVASILG